MNVQKNKFFKKIETKIKQSGERHLVVDGRLNKKYKGFWQHKKKTLKRFSDRIITSLVNDLSRNGGNNCRPFCVAIDRIRLWMFFAFAGLNYRLRSVIAGGMAKYHASVPFYRLKSCLYGFQLDKLYLHLELNIS